jgi:hypothetical protein
MATYRSSRILPTVLTVIIIIVAIAGLVGLVRLLFTGSTSSTPEQDVNVSQQNLLDTTEGRSVSMTVRGPIVADEDFRSYQIIVSPDTREIISYSGYLADVLDQESLPNNTAAYDQFVHALDKANMVKGTPFEEEKNNVLGICATGRVYEFSVMNANSTDQMLWTSTCSGSPGSLRASSAQLSQLFLNQIPNSSKITNSLKI